MEESKRVWTDDYKVLLNNTYPDGKAKLTAYLAYFQESAWHHADNLGFGFEKIDDSGLLWVLVKLQLDINEFAAWGETVQVETWPVGIEKIFARRDFHISNRQGKKVVSGVSWWLVLEKPARRPASIDIVKKHIHLTTSVHAIEAKPVRIAMPEKVQKICIHHVVYSEIDIHGHVNNTCYPEWVFNALGSGWVKNHSISSFGIDFTNEAFDGEQIELFMAEGEAGECFFKGIRTSDEKEIFKMWVGLNKKAGQWD